MASDSEIAGAISVLNEVLAKLAAANEDAAWLAARLADQHHKNVGHTASTEGLGCATCAALAAHEARVKGTAGGAP